MKKQQLGRKAAIVAASASVAISATAATTDAAVKTSAVPDSAAVTLNSVEITANRAGARTPVAYTNIKSKELAKSNDGRDLPFMLQATPSIVVTGDAGGGVGYSGIRVRGTDPTRINVTANGVPINDSESSRVYWVNMPDIASSLRDVQIQRGAGTSTNGAGAFGASINMITDAPSREPGSEVSTSYGSYNTNRQTIKVRSGRFADRWSADARISHIGSNGYIDRATSRLWSYMGQLAYTGNQTSVRLLAFGGKERTYMAWDYPSKEEMDKYGRRYNPSGKFTASDGSTAFYSDQYDNYAQHHLHLIGAHNFNQNLKLNLSLHYTNGDGYYEQYKTNRTLAEYGLHPFVDAAGQKVKKSDLVRRKFVGSDFGGGVFSLVGQWERVNFVAGGAANWYLSDHAGRVLWVRNYMGAINPLQPYYGNTGRKFDSNIYSRADVLLTGSLSVYGDLQLRHIRYSIRGISDNFDYNTGTGAALDVNERYTFFNPKAGVAYNDGPYRAYLSWSVAHKEPVRDNFTDSDREHYPTPERMFDYEAGWSYNTPSVTVGAGVYYMDYRDQLVLTGQLSDTGNPITANVPNSYRAGIELQGVWRPAKWFEWSANATLSRNRIKDYTEYIYEEEWTNPITLNYKDTPISFSPDLTASNIFSVNYNGWEGSFATRYVSSQYMNNAASPEARLDAYCVSDLSAGYTFRNIPGVKGLRLGATVYNIFNALYFNNGYAGAGYTVGKDGKKEIYRYAGFAAQTPLNILATLTLTL